MNEVGLKKISNVEYEIPKSGKMLVPSRLFASEALLRNIRGDRTLEQLQNMACLPGIQKYAIALPDAHQGYGFCIGGVAALSCEDGGISPGGVGYDINCGVRLLRSNISADETVKKIKELVNVLFEKVPSGLGSGNYRVKKDELLEVLEKGSGWAVSNGHGDKQDLFHTEEDGRMKMADSSTISERAITRGLPQLGSLGAGNHFLEVQKVDKVFDDEAARVFGLEEGMTTIMIHCGSRGLGHQVCSDYLRMMEEKYSDLIKGLPDRELVYAPGGTDMAEQYFKAMCCAANYAWNNRQMIMSFVRKGFEKVFDNDYKSLGMGLVYDVCHNMAKVEKHEGVKCYVHRKGATRSFPPHNSLIPSDYSSVGQPVLIPGSMGTASYVLAGTMGAMNKTFGSTAHGSGRLMSRTRARKSWTGESVRSELLKKHIIVRSASMKVLSEEAPRAYKDVDEVVRVSHEAGIGKLVARLVPLGVVKG